MNTSGTHHAATLATATAVATALTILSAVMSASAPAGAHRPDPVAGATTQCVGSVGSPGDAGTGDGTAAIAQRKAEAAQYYVDHAVELHRLAAR
jgi:hypothetical protein